MARRLTTEQLRIKKQRQRARARARNRCRICLVRDPDPGLLSCAECREVEATRKLNRLQPINTTDDAANAAEENPIHDAPGNY